MREPRAPSSIVMRLDQAVAARFPQYSRRKARDLIASRQVLVNDRPVAVASRNVEDSDRIAVIDDLPPFDIIRESAEWVAVNKPAGLPTQPPADRSARSLEELLRVKYPEIYLIHRIDTPASGVVLFARTRQYAARLSELFAARSVRKLYLVRATGSTAIEQELTIETPIDGKEAITIVRPLRGDLLEVEIRTGRTHQIRRHLASIGLPLLGDRRYGGAAAPRLMLHAWKLELADVGELIAPPPESFGLL